LSLCRSLQNKKFTGKKIYSSSLALASAEHYTPFEADVHYKIVADRGRSVLPGKKKIQSQSPVA